MSNDVDMLKRRLPLLDYLRQHHWSARQIGSGPEFVGLCPLHAESHPSFYVHAQKNLFYCHGCGRGGDLLRFVQLHLNLSFSNSVTHLREQLALPDSSREDLLE